MDRNELKAMMAEVMNEMAQEQKSKGVNANDIAQKAMAIPVVGQVGSAAGATLSGVLAIAGSVFEGVGHVTGTASTAIGQVGYRLNPQNK